VPRTGRAQRKENASSDHACGLLAPSSLLLQKMAIDSRRASEEAAAKQLQVDALRRTVDDLRASLSAAESQVTLQAQALEERHAAVAANANPMQRTFSSSLQRVHKEQEQQLTARPASPANGAAMTCAAAPAVEFAPAPLPPSSAFMPPSASVVAALPVIPRAARIPALPQLRTASATVGAATVITPRIAAAPTAAAVPSADKSISPIIVNGEAEDGAASTAAMTEHLVSETAGAAAPGDVSLGWEAEAASETCSGVLASVLGEAKAPAASKAFVKTGSGKPIGLIFAQAGATTASVAAGENDRG
jgi:hypothetical protein